MRLVLDQGVPRGAASALRDLGHECLHVGEIGMRNAEGEEILAFSSKLEAVVVTLDADFHAILAVSAASGPSVIRLRLQALSGPDLANLVRKVLVDFESDLPPRISGYGEETQNNLSSPSGGSTGVSVNGEEIFAFQLRKIAKNVPVVVIEIVEPRCKRMALSL